MYLKMIIFLIVTGVLYADENTSLCIQTKSAYLLSDLTPDDYLIKGDKDVICCKFSSNGIFCTDIKPGKYTVSIVKENYQDLSQDIVIQKNKVNKFTLYLFPKKSIIRFNLISKVSTEEKSPALITYYNSFNRDQLKYLRIPSNNMFIPGYYRFKILKVGYKMAVLDYHLSKGNQPITIDVELLPRKRHVFFNLHSISNNKHFILKLDNTIFKNGAKIIPRLYTLSIFLKDKQLFKDKVNIKASDKDFYMKIDLP